MKTVAPAKINLFLEVKKKRSDGYHSIESIMQEISLFDTIMIFPAAKNITLSCSFPGLATDASNLVVKAAMLLKKELKIDSGAKIVLDKRIPLGAGLGGGSSDAAATLRGLLQVWKRHMSYRKLVRLASRIGADVPFFIRGGTALARGIGDILTPIKNVRKSFFVVVFPNVSIPTASVYRKLHFPLTNRRESNKIKSLLEASKRAREWETYIYNRLEEVVLPRYKTIFLVRKKIESLGYRSLMSGSGSAVFGIVPSRKEGERVRRRLSSTRWKVWVVESFDSASKA